MQCSYRSEINFSNHLILELSKEPIDFILLLFTYYNICNNACLLHVVSKKILDIDNVESSVLKSVVIEVCFHVAGTQIVR